MRWIFLANPEKWNGGKQVANKSNKKVIKSLLSNRVALVQNKNEKNLAAIKKSAEEMTILLPTY